MRRAIAGVCWMALVCSMTYGQAADAKLEFEVASVKPAAPQGPGRFMVRMRGGPGSPDPGLINYENVSLQDLVTNAFGIKRSQISGGPNWLESERFDLTAKVPQGTTKEEAKVMMQNLLADRFKLAVHHETKEMAMYALIVGKNGSKLKESAPVAADADAPPDGGRGDGPPPPPPMMGGRGRMQMGKDGCPEIPAVAGKHPNNFMMLMNGTACVVATNQTMSGLADMLSNQFDRPVTDMTGLKGKYDFRLRFDPSSLGGGGRGPMMMMGPPPGAMAAGGGPGRGGDAGPVPNAEPQDTPPPIFAAMQEQLGLKLEARKGPVDLLVIDHIEKTPTAN